MRSTTQTTLRRIVGTSVVVIATVVPAGVAAAADYPSGGNPPAVSPNQGSNVRAATTTQTNPSTLPFTGGDVAGLALIGVGAVLAGTVIVRRSRRHAEI
jgi:uncharacterized surface anchored protein